MSRATEIVLDASALLAALNNEPGADEVARVLDRAVMGAVNLSEVLVKLSERGASPDEAWTVIAATRIRIVDFDAELAREAARLRPATQSAGLSLGDRACLALARHLKAEVLTTDRAWKSLKLGITVKFLR